MNWKRQREEMEALALQDGSCKGIIDGMVAMSEKSIGMREDDYIDGSSGLLYCGRCRTPKQGVYKMPWGEIKPYILCKCEAERKEREEQEQRARELADLIRRRRSAGFPEKEMQNWTFARDDESNKRMSGIAHRYADNFPQMLRDNKGLLLFGNVGVGKSFYAACIVNALIDLGYPCLMTNFIRLTNTLQGMFEGKQEYIDSLNRYSLLVIDDLGVERDTKTMNELVYSLIDSRYRAGLPIIVTTNLTSEELKKPNTVHEERIFSRLMEMCIPLEVKGCDRRKQKLKTDFGEYKDILGL